MRKRWLILVIAATLCFPQVVGGQADIYRTPQQFALPWACGESYRITWGPAEHWQNHKARGIAFDVAMPEGTPVYSPTNGWIYYLRDERLLETNYGNYVEIVSSDGNWMIRLAHLRDEKQGEGPIKAGTLVGFAGRSGVPSPHLHIELLVRNGVTWDRPDLSLLTEAFGLRLEDLEKGAIITNAACDARPALATPHIMPTRAEYQLGETALLRVPLLNQGLEPLDLDTVQVLLVTPEGTTHVGQIQGDWHLGAKQRYEITVPVDLPKSGTWHVVRVTCSNTEGSASLAATGRLTIAPSPLSVSSISIDPSSRWSESPLLVSMTIRNQGNEPLQFEDLFIETEKPNGERPLIWLGYGDELAAGQTGQYAFVSSQPLRFTGQWKIVSAGYLANQRMLRFAQLDQSFTVQGPELYIRSLDIYTTGTGLHLFLRVENRGTAAAYPDALDLWAWRSDGAALESRVLQVAEIAPQQSSLLHFIVEDESNADLELAEVGYWAHAAYHPIPLPERLVIPHR